MTSDTFADLGLEGGGTLNLPDGATLVERAAADPNLVARCAGTLAYGSGISVAQVTTTAATGTRLFERYAADTESMEGFSILRGAEVAGVPALQVRGISNYVGDRRTSEWDFTAGARAVAMALESVLRKLAAGGSD